MNTPAALFIRMHGIHVSKTQQMPWLCAFAGFFAYHERSVFDEKEESPCYLLFSADLSP